MNKECTLIVKGAAVILMLMLHLFSTAPQITSDLWSFTGIHKILGNFSSICVSIFVFLSSYGLTKAKGGNSIYYYVNKQIKLYSHTIFIGFIFVPLLVIMGFITLNLKTIVLSFFCLGGGVNNMWWFVAYYPLLLLTVYFIKKHNIPSSVLLYIAILDVIIYSLCYAWIEPWMYKSVIVGVPSYILNYIIRYQYVQLLPSLILGILSARDFIPWNKLIKGTSPIAGIVTLFLLFIIFVIIMNLDNPVLERIYYFLRVPLFIIAIIKASFILKYINIFLTYIGKISMDIWLIHGFFYFYMFDYFKLLSTYWIIPFIIFILVNILFAELIKRIKFI